MININTNLKNRQSQEMEKQYLRWKEKALQDRDVVEELQSMGANKDQIEDAYYQDLMFGTGGLRGVIGAGTNRMNVYTVAKASQGLVNYLKKRCQSGAQKIAISYDSRIKSDLFAKVSAGVFAANGINVQIYPDLMPTPCLSFAVRYLNCAAGIMVTASHNPAKYNGYKVYGADGCQITSEAADEILYEIEKLDIFEDIQSISFEQGVAAGSIGYIQEKVYTAFIEAVKKESLLDEDTVINKDVSIVYSPLNGTGLKPVLRTLKESGYTNITVVKEQEYPDGRFPTCPYPNPEIEEAMELGIQKAKEHDADLMIATDPDCDRAGIAAKDQGGNYRLLSGNETGMLLLDYICSRRMKMDKMPADPVLMKTIVTIDMAERIAANYGVRTINVLTGFKYIGEQIGILEASGKEDSYIFGFEESYGYLSGTYVRDKDAVDAVFLICEMFAYYKTRGVSLLEKLENLYRTYGYCINSLHSFVFEGAEGSKTMQRIMDTLRNGLDFLGEKRVLETIDYAIGINGLPKSDVLKFVMEGNTSVVVRPSGTEPKIKVYLSVSADSMEKAKQFEYCISMDIKQLFDK